MKRVISIILSLMLLVGLLPTAPVTAADNLAANGDLELGSTSGWEIANAAVDGSVTYGGNYSLKLTSTSAYSGAAYKIVPVGKGATVTVSFYYRYETRPSSGKLYHVYTYQGDNPYSGTYSNADKSFTYYSYWKKITYTFNSGDYANIYLKFCPGGSGSSACYIDNLVVTATGGTQEKVDPYLVSFGTKYNRPSAAGYNLLADGGFESSAADAWNGVALNGSTMEIVSDSTAPEGERSLYFHSTSASARYDFPVAVEPYTHYTFSAWVKSPRLSDSNRATATFGVANAQTGDYLVYEPYNGNGHGAASLSTPTMQLMATAPDDAWHLRSVTFYSGTSTTVNVAVSGARSCLYLDDMALYKSAYGVEYISPLRTDTITAAANSGNKYCADDSSLLPYVHMSGKAAENYWSDNPAWRNGFLSMEQTGDDHGTALKYTASANTLRQLCYIDWIDVTPHTDYTLTMDVKRLVAGGGRMMLLDDNVLSPAEFYTLSFNETDSDWVTHSITFNSGVYSRIGFGIVDGGGQAYIDKTRLFRTVDGVADEPTEVAVPALYPLGGKTAVMEMGTYTPENLIQNGDFESGVADGWDVYQDTLADATAERLGGYGAHLQGGGSYGALLEQCAIPVTPGESYEVTFWYQAQSGGVNWTLFGEQSGTAYVGGWIDSEAWQLVRVPFTCGADTTVRLNFCGGGNGTAEEVYLDDVTLTKTGGGPLLGVGFLFELNTTGAAMDEQYRAYLTNATVDVYGDGAAYPLKEMGCVVTNDAAVGNSRTAFTRDNVDDANDTLVDVSAERLCRVTDTTAYFAVRVIDIPYRFRNAVIYARPYYVFVKDGEEVVVYGNIYCRSYTDPNGSGSFTLG